MKDSTVTAIFAIVIILALVAIGGPFITMFCWWAVIPDVFGGAVAAELLPSKLTWWQAFKIMFCLSAALGVSRLGGSSK